MAATDEDERVYMISGIDEMGDTEMFMTRDRARADARYLDMQGRLKDVQRNDAWDDADDISNDS